jgi:spore coat polysaccharide biosynthesis predicted glycosyltransferase SpsG
MRIGIRCDAGGDYGLGHISRMNSLVRALKQCDSNTEITFYSKTPDLWMSQRSPVNCDIVKFAEDESEPRLMRHIYEQALEDVLIIDRKEYYESEILRSVKKAMRVVCIDMPWARPEECDLLVIPNLHQSPSVLDQLDNLFDDDALLVGSDYILIRDEVLWTRPISYKRRDNMIAFFAGGSDPCRWLELMYNMSESLTELLPNIHRLYCIGEHGLPLYVRPGDANASVTGYSHNILAKCALAVSTFGVTPYEALHLRTPIITSGHTKQNEVGSQYLSAATEGATCHIPPLDDMMREDFCNYIESIWNDLSLRKDMHHKSAGLVPDDGAINIAERILCLDQ